MFSYKRTKTTVVKMKQHQNNLNNFQKTFLFAFVKRLFIEIKKTRKLYKHINEVPGIYQPE